MYFSKELYTILLTIESPLSKMSKIKVLNKAELMLQILHIHFMMQCSDCMLCLPLKNKITYWY